MGWDVALRRSSLKSHFGISLVIQHKSCSQLLIRARPSWVSADSAAADALVHCTEQWNNTITLAAYEIRLIEHRFGLWLAPFKSSRVRVNWSNREDTAIHFQRFVLQCTKITSAFAWLTPSKSLFRWVCIEKSVKWESPFFKWTIIPLWVTAERRCLSAIAHPVKCMYSLVKCSVLLDTVDSDVDSH